MWVMCIYTVTQAAVAVNKWNKDFFFIGEGPRSRRYGRTEALRLLVQPYDEDDEDYYYFLSIS
jgi:hypothetical protein